MVWLRSVSSRSGPSRALAEQHQHGAGAGLLVLRRHEPGQVVDGDRAGGLLDRPQPVGSRPGVPDVVVTGSHPEMLADQVDDSSLRVEPAELRVGDPALGVDEADRGSRGSSRTRRAPGGHRPGRPAAGRYAAFLGQLQRAAGVLVVEVDAEDRHLVAVLLVEGLEDRHLLLARRAAGVPEVDHHRPPQRGEVDARAAAEARQRHVGQRAAARPGHAVLDAGLGLELAQLGGVDRRPCSVRGRA